jgi:hypothetical protein
VNPNSRRSPFSEYHLLPEHLFDDIDAQLQRVVILPGVHDLYLDDLDMDIQLEERAGHVLLGVRYQDDTTHFGTAPEEISITLYNDKGKEIISPELLRDTHSTVQAKLDFAKDIPGNTFNGRMLFLASKEILITYNAKLEDPETFGEEFHYFADRLGLKDLWDSILAEDEALLRGPNTQVSDQIYANRTLAVGIGWLLREVNTGKLET